jgi:hypothetical protein
LVTGASSDSETDLVQQFRPNVDYSFRTRRRADGVVTIDLEKRPGFSGVHVGTVELGESETLDKLFESEGS